MRFGALCSLRCKWSVTLSVWTCPSHHSWCSPWPRRWGSLCVCAAIGACASSSSVSRVQSESSALVPSAASAAPHTEFHLHTHTVLPSNWKTPKTRQQCQNLHWSLTWAHDVPRTTTLLIQVRNFILQSWPGKTKEMNTIHMMSLMLWFLQFISLMRHQDLKLTLASWNALHSAH